MVQVRQTEMVGWLRLASFPRKAHMLDPLMLLCKLALLAQTCTRIRWQCDLSIRKLCKCHNQPTISIYLTRIYE